MTLLSTLVGGIPALPEVEEFLDFTLSTSVGDQDVVLSSAISKDRPPIAVGFVAGGTTGAAPAGASHAKLSVGVFDGTNQWVQAIQDQDNVGPTNSDRRGATDECIMILDTDGSVLAEANGVSLLPNGVRINVGATNGTAYNVKAIFFFAVGGSAVAGTFATSGSVDGSVTITPGQSTSLLLTASIIDASAFNDTVVATTAISFGFVVPSIPKQVCASVISLSGASPSDVRSEVRNDSGICNAFNAQRHEFGNFTSTQFDCTTRSDATVIAIGYLSIYAPKAQFYADVLDTPTSVSAVDYTDAGFHGTRLMGLAMMNDTVNTDETDLDAEHFGVFASDVSANSTIAIRVQDDVVTTITRSRYEANIRAARVTSFVSVEATFSAQHDDGFTLDFSAVDTEVKKWPYVLARGH